MIFVLFICCLWLLCFAYFTSGKNLLSPSFNVCLSFCISIAIYISVYENWGYFYSQNGVLMIVVCLMAFTLGQISGSIVFGGGKLKAALDNEIYHTLYYKMSFAYMSVIFICYGIYASAYILILLQNLRDIGWNGDISAIPKVIRQATIKDMHALDMPLALGLLRMFFQALCYYLIYLTLHNYILYNSKNAAVVIVALMTIMYLSMQFLMGRRGELLQLGAFIYATILLKIYQKNNPSDAIAYKTMKYGCLSFVSIVLPLFFIVGLAKKHYAHGVYNELAIYGGSALQTFDMYLNEGGVHNTFFGQECLGPLYRLLGRFGLELPEGIRFLEFRYWGDGFRSNIYTAFRRYIQDFDIVGALIILFFIGLAAAYWFEKIRRHRSGTFCNIVYASCFYVWLMFAIDELILNNLLSASNIAFVFFVYAIVALHERIIRKRKSGRNACRQTVPSAGADYR